MSYCHDVPTLDRLEVLGSLLRTRSPTASARELGVTQSAVSKTLAALRDELSDPLLVRRGDAMLLTPRAERLRAPLASALAALRNVVANTEVPAGPAAVTIALRDQFVLSLGAGIVRGIGSESARTAVRLVSYERVRIGDELATGAVDLAIAVDPPEEAGLLQAVLYHETFVCVAPRRPRLTLRAYLAAGHVTTTAHSGYSGIDETLLAMGHTRRIVASTTYFIAAANLAQELGLIATVPERLARALSLRRSSVHALPFPSPSFSTRMIWDVRADNDPTNQWLRSLVRRAASAGNS
jgi:DNA-binding transcriptional LysR family regulator